MLLFHFNSFLFFDVVSRQAVMVFALISYSSPAFALISYSFSPSVFPFFRQSFPLCLLVSPYKSTFLLCSFPLCVLLSLPSSLLLPHSLVFFLCHSSCFTRCPLRSFPSSVSPSRFLSPSLPLSVLRNCSESSQLKNKY